MILLPAAPLGAMSEISDLKLRGLYQYWLRKCDGRAAPARRDIDPAEIPSALGFVNLLEVLDDPRDFRFRLNGTAVVEMIGRDVTGELHSAVMGGEDGVWCRNAYEMCVDRRSAVAVETSLGFCGKPYMCQTILALPLSDDGESIDTIMSGHSYRAIGATHQTVDGLSQTRVGNR
jgi:hypothetical protein